MGIKQDVKENLKGFHVTKIDGQPMDEDLNQLETEHSKMAASIPTLNGGGSHGHVGMIADDAVSNFFYWWHCFHTTHKSRTLPNDGGSRCNDT